MQRNDLTSSDPTAPRRSRRFNRAASRRGIRLAPLLLVAVMLAAAALFGDQPVHGQTTTTLVSNTGQDPTILFEGNPPITQQLNTDRDARSQPFTTGSDATEYRLDSIGIRFGTIDANSDPASELTVTLNTVTVVGIAQLVNDEVLCTLTNPATFTSDAVNTFHAPTLGDLCPYLKPSTTYGVAVTRANANTHEISLFETSSYDEDELTPPTGWTIHNDAGVRFGPTHSNTDIVGNWVVGGNPLMIEVRGEVIAPQLTSAVTAFRVESVGWNAASAYVTVTSPGTVFIRWRAKSETNFGAVRFAGEPNEDGELEILSYPYMRGMRYVVQASQDESFSDPAQVEFTHDWKNVIRDIQAIEVTHTTVLVEVTVVPSDQEQTVWVFTGFADLPRNWHQTRLVIPANTSSATTLVENLAMGRRYILDAWDQTPAHRTFFNRFPRESFTTPAPVTLSRESLNIDEGTSDEYTVVLDNQPTGNVTISISAGREVTIQPTGAGTGIILAGDALTTQPTSLLFTTTNWDTPQTVTVSAGHDEDYADDTFTITHTVASGSAAEYAALTVLPDVHVAVLDDEVYHQVKTLRTLVANTGSGNNQAQSISTSGIDRWAQGFTTGIAGGGYVLGSVGLRLADTDSNASPGDLEVTLNQVAANGHPGDALCTLNNPASLQQRTVNAFTAPTAGDGRCPALKPNTKHFVVIKRISGTRAIRLTKTYRNGEDSGHAAKGWSIGDSSRYAHAESTVWLSDVNALKLDIEGDYVPALTAIDASAEESGDPNSSTTMTFLIFLDQKVKHAVSVSYATEDGTAKAGTNYNHTSGTVTFAPEEQIQFVDVDILDDGEGGRTYFMLVLSNPRRAGLRNNAPGTGTIYGVSPRFRSWPESARESGNGNDTQMNFYVKIYNRDDNSTYAIDYATVNGAARAGSDYTATSGTLIFEPGDNSYQQVTVPILDDSIEDSGETFSFVLSNPTGGAELDRLYYKVKGTILNEDAPGVSASFPTTAHTSISHTGTDDRPKVVVAFSEPIATFNKNTPSVQVANATVYSVAPHTEEGIANAYIFTLNPDGEGEITFALLSNADCGSGGICNSAGIKLIETPEILAITGPEPPRITSQLSVSEATASEEDDSTIDFVVTLNPASEESVTVDYATSNGSATAGDDYTAKSGTLAFTAGQTSKTIQVSIIDDTIDDDNETFTLTLSSPNGAQISDASGTGTISNSEPVQDPPVEDPPAQDPVVLLTASFANVPSDHNGSNFAFQLSFSENVEAGYARIRDHAFTVTGATIDSASRITQGSNQGWNVEVNPTGNEAITITLPETTNCDASGAICTDDSRKLSHPTSAIVAGPPAISVSDATVQEAEGAVLVFSITLSHGSSRTVTVDYATSDGTAQAGSDYTAASATLTFNAGETSQTVQVTVLTDSENESQETLTLTLSSPSQATLDDGTGTIENGESSSGTQEDPPAEDPPVVLLTASFSNMPATHNGSAFTFDLAFSEDFPLSYVTLRDDAFTVDGGNVQNAQRKVPGSNQTWTITVKPLGAGTISITLPETTDCNATDAICTDDERKLSNSTPASIAGPQ